MAILKGAHTTELHLIDLIWVYYDLSSAWIYDALYKFLKSHWMHYEIDYVNINTFLNNEQNGDTVWLHVLSGFTAVIALFELNLSYRAF